MSDRNKKSGQTAAGKTDKPAKAPELKPRNPLAAHPLLKKSHSHEKPAKAQRSKDKQALRKQVLDDD